MWVSYFILKDICWNKLLEIKVTFFFGSTFKHHKRKLNTKHISSAVFTQMKFLHRYIKKDKKYILKIKYQIHDNITIFLKKYFNRYFKNFLKSKCSVL